MDKHLFRLLFFLVITAWFAITMMLPVSASGQQIDSLILRATQAETPHEQAAIQQQISNYYYQREQFKLAENHMLIALDLNNDDTTSMAYNEYLLSLSAIYQKQNLEQKSMMFSMRAKNLATLYDHKNIYVASLINLAVALKELGKNKEAESYALEAYELYRQKNDSLMMAYATNILGMISRNLEEYDKAADYYSRSFEIRQNLGSEIEQLIILGNMANLLKLEGNYDSAERLFKEANHIAINTASKYFLASNYFNLARLMLLREDTASALQYFDSSLNIAGQKGHIQLESQIYEALADIHYAKKDYRLAWEFNHKLRLLNDSISRMDNSMNLDEMHLLFENQSKQIQIDKLEHERARNFQIFHMVVIALLIIIIILIYLRSVKIRRARDLINDSERKFRMLAENSSEVIWASDTSLNLTYISPSTEQLLGYPRDERVKKPMKEVFGDDSYQKLKKAFDQNLQKYKQGQKVDPINIELKGFHKDGQEVWVEITTDFSYDESGKITGLQGIARDITARKTEELRNLKMIEELSLQDEVLKVQNEELIEARNEVEKTAEKYYDLFENGPVGYLILDENGIITRLNSTAANMLNLPKEKIQDRHFLNFIIKEDKQSFSRCLKETISNNKIRQREFRISGITARIVLVPDNSQKRMMCRLAMVDITAEVEVREKLSMALQSLQTVFDAIPGGISVVDKNFRIININERLQKIHGISDRSGVIGKKCYEVFNCGSEPCGRCIWKQVMESGKPVVRHSSSDDPVYRAGAYRIYSSPMFDSNGTITGIVEAAMDISDLHKAEQALAESEQKFKDLFNDIPDAVFITRIGENSGQIVDVNASAVSQTGYSRDELLRMNVLRDISIGTILPQLTNEREALLLKNEMTELTEQKRRKDGSLIWTEVVIQKIVIDGENLALSVSRDISDRVKIQDELKRSEARVRSLLSALPDLLFIFDREGNFMEYHALTPGQLLYPPDQFLNQNIREIMPEHITKLTLENIEKTFETGRMQLWDYCIDGPEGKSFFDVRMVKASANSVLSVVRDITEARKAEEARKQNQEKYKTIFRNTPLGVFNFNSEGVILDCNEHFVKIIGSSHDDLIGFNMLTRVTDVELRKCIDDAIRLGSAVYEGTYASVTANKKTAVKGFFKCIYNEEGEFIDGIGIVEDVSEQKEYESKLLKAKSRAEESDRLKSSFMATMSHELRTPLNTVIGFSDMIEESMPIDQVLEFTQVISKSGRHLLSIIEDILDISLIDSGEVKLVIERISIDNLMEGLYNFASQQKITMDKDHIEISTVIPESFKNTKFRGDARKIHKVFGHLIRNALKFTREGRIEIGIEEDLKTSSPDYVILYVKDTGIGIPKDKHEVIFEIFRQADDSSTREFEGTGLGLTISRKLILMMGGRIWLNSEPGKGSVFYFELPLKASAADTLNKLNKYHKPLVNNMKGTTVLVAEDDDTNFHLFKLLLNRRQIDVIRAKNGEEAVNKTSENHNIKLVLMDINMPVLNGYDATRRIKEHNEKLPIIAVTAYAMVGDRERAEEAGCDDYITKPINNQIFYETIGKYLQEDFH